jgi:hypothetical protein
MAFSTTDFLAFRNHYTSMLTIRGATVTDNFAINFVINKKRKLQGDSLARGPKLLEKRIQVCLDLKGDHFQHRL